MFATIGLSHPATGQNTTFEYDGLTRQYRLHPHEQMPELAPLVVVLHGYSGGNNDMLNNYGWTTTSDPTHQPCGTA